LLKEFDEGAVWYAGVPGAGGDDAIFLIGDPNIDLKQLVKERFT
jgi:phosphomevalonate kinase